MDFLHSGQSGLDSQYGFDHRPFVAHWRNAHIARYSGYRIDDGMAVDANVLIYERIREERRGGRSLIQAIDAGFRQALSTIIDANITTLIAALILFYLGSGPVKGFAVTLAVGIMTTVFTAYTVTRLLVALWVKWKKPKELPKRLISFIPENTKLRFMRNRSLPFLSQQSR